MAFYDNIILAITTSSMWVPTSILIAVIVLFILFVYKYLKPDHTIKETEYININLISTTRYVYLVMAIFYPLYGFSHMSSPYCLYDPMYQRLITSGICVTAFILSFKSTFFRENFDKFLILTYYIFLSHFFFLLFKNNFAFEYMLGLMIVLCGSFTILKQLKEGYFLVGFISAALAISLYFNTTVNFLEIKALITICFAMALIIILSLFARASRDTQLLIANKFVNESHALMFVYDTAGTIIYASNSITNILGYTPLEVVDGSWNKSKNYNQDRNDELQDYIKKLAQNQIASKEHKYQNYLTKSGEEKWISWRDKHIEGNLVLSVGYDVTEQRASELEVSKLSLKLEIIHSIESTILASETTEEIIYNTLNKLLEKLPIVRSSFTLNNIKNGTFYAYVRTKNGERSINDKKTFKSADLRIYNMLRDNKKSIIVDLDKEPLIVETDNLFIDAGGKHMLFTPLFQDGNLLGSINMVFPEDIKEDLLWYKELTEEISLGIAITIHQSKLKDQVYASNKNIKDSINYAKMIQEAYVPNDINHNNKLPNSFVINKPKDIVSGDFHWVGQTGNKLVVVAADCTGHGVPGAFMTMIGISSLNNIVNERNMTDPADILTELDLQIKKAINSTAESQIKDGMDAGISVIDLVTKEFHFEGARRPLYYLDKNELKIVPGTKLSIGETLLNYDVSFKSKKIEFSEGAMFYMFSDGYVDQFGGENRRRFMSKRIKEMLIGIQSLSVEDQKMLITNTLSDWQGDVEQTDDMLFVGFKI